MAIFRSFKSKGRTKVQPELLIGIYYNANLSYLKMLLYITNTYNSILFLI